LQEACRKKREREALAKKLEACAAHISEEHAKLDAFVTGLKTDSEEVKPTLSRGGMKQYELNKELEEYSKDTKAFLDAYSTVTSALQRVGIDIPKLNKKLGVEDASLMELRRLKLGTKPLTEVRPNHRYARVPTCDIDAVYARSTSGGGLRRGLRNCGRSTRTVFQRCRVKKTKQHIE
jgi:seryl-tRNA synthetase